MLFQVPASVIAPLLAAMQVFAKAETSAERSSPLIFSRVFAASPPR